MSAKASSQAGRRTPLSLSGAIAKPQHGKGGGAGGAGANGHSNVGTKHDTKANQQKTEQTASAVEIKETSAASPKDTRKQQNAEKKQQVQQLQQLQQQQQQHNAEAVKKVDKQANGMSEKNNVNKTETREKREQPGIHESKPDENSKQRKDKAEALEKSEQSNEKKQKEEKKAKNDKNQAGTKDLTKPETNVNEEDKRKGTNVEDLRKDANEGNRPTENKKSDTEIPKTLKKDSRASKERKDVGECVEIMDDEGPVLKSTVPETPTKVNIADRKAATPSPRTPRGASAKSGERTSVETTLMTTLAKTSTTVMTTAIDDDEMEPLAEELSPIKPKVASGEVMIPPPPLAPTVTSTPGRTLLPKRGGGAKTDVELATQVGNSVERRPRNFSEITGRRSIHPVSDYVPSTFKSNSHFRESYRRINTELDVTSNTNSSLNVTVGSDVPNNSSFSFFGRGRKRDHTPPKTRSAVGEVHTDMDASPPKRARLDMYGLFSAVSSPLSLLRARFSKTSLQSSTPVKQDQKVSNKEDEVEVQNVSGLSVDDEELARCDGEEQTTTEDLTIGMEAVEKTIKKGIPQGAAAKDNAIEIGAEDSLLEAKEKCSMEVSSNIGPCSEGDLDIKITETAIVGATGDPSGKNKKCVVM